MRTNIVIDDKLMAATLRATGLSTKREVVDGARRVLRDHLGSFVPAHPIAGALDVAKRLGEEKGPDATVIINLSGRGDKDMGTAIEWFGLGDAEGEAEPVIATAPGEEA